MIKTFSYGSTLPQPAIVETPEAEVAETAEDLPSKEPQVHIVNLAENLVLSES